MTSTSPGTLTSPSSLSTSRPKIRPNTNRRSLSSASNSHCHYEHLLSTSALLDKETNSIYWQDVNMIMDNSILSASLTRPYLTQKGVRHVKATFLTALLWAWLWGRLARWLTRPAIDTPTRLTVSPPLRFLLLLGHSLFYVRLPPYSPLFLLLTVALYLLESWGCSTAHYLRQAVSAPRDLERYLEDLREKEPVVRWRVQCFHYEPTKMGSVLGKGWWKIIMSWKSTIKGGDLDWEQGKELPPKDEGQSFEKPSSIHSTTTTPSWMARKVVTHEAIGNYKFGSWEDQTQATLWNRALSFSSDNNVIAPFGKLSLSKLLVLKDKRAREDYFAQQAAFVMLQGRKDVHAEFSTSIEVPGFRPKLLAIRHARKFSPVFFFFRLHVYYVMILLGLSLPYRIWFANHCDHIRVMVIKETSDSTVVKEEESVGRSNNSGSEENQSISWFRSKWGWGPSSHSSPSSLAELERKRMQELFRSKMQSFSLYEEEPSSLDPQTDGSKPSKLVEEGESTRESNTVELKDEISIESSEKLLERQAPE